MIVHVFGLQFKRFSRNNDGARARIEREERPQKQIVVYMNVRNAS